LEIDGREVIFEKAKRVQPRPSTPGEYLGLKRRYYSNTYSRH